MLRTSNQSPPQQITLQVKRESFCKQGPTSTFRYVFSLWGALSVTGSGILPTQCHSYLLLQGPCRNGDDKDFLGKALTRSIIGEPSKQATPYVILRLIHLQSHVAQIKETSTRMEIIHICTNSMCRSDIFTPPSGHSSSGRSYAPSESDLMRSSR
jgi:hypothetical protein